MDGKPLPKVYIYPAGPFGGGDVVMVALAESGDWYLSHICSDPSWGRFDLHDRPNREASYVEKFGGWGNGLYYDLVILDTVDDIPLATLVAAGMRNEDGSRPERTGDS